MKGLGLYELQCGWRVRFVPRSAASAVKLATELISLVGMTPDGEAEIDIRSYPNEQGNGGQGFQVYLRRVYQPLVESWIIIGTWPEHGFTRINLSSCKPYEPGQVSSYLSLLGEVVKEYEQEL